MALWDKLKTELDRAGRAAQTALDEGKVRLEILRVRQLADKAAQALGYAVFRARRDGQELDADSYARLSSTLAAHEAEVQRMEAQLEAIREEERAQDRAAAGPADTAADTASADAGDNASGGETPRTGTPGSGPAVDPAMGDAGAGTNPGTPSGGPTGY